MRSFTASAFALTLVAGLTSAAMAQSHGHITIGNTDGDFFAPGSPPAAGVETYEIKTYTTESLTLGSASLIGSFTSQRVLSHGEQLVIKLPYTAGTGSQPGLGNWGGPFDGFYRNAGVTFATDFYTTIAGGGENVGGDGQFEILEVIPLNGSPAAVFGIGGGTTLTFASNYAISDGSDQLLRSFQSGSGQHVHGQRLYLSEKGIYDVTLRAWDANGIYNDSTPITLTIQVPEPASMSLLGLGSALLLARRRGTRAGVAA